MPFLCFDGNGRERETALSAFADPAAAAFRRTPLVVSVMGVKREREGRSTAVVVQGYGFRDPASGREVWVPPTYLTDFASIPRIARAFVEPFGRHAAAAVIHDWLYSIGEPDGRAFADDVFLAAMTEAEVHRARRAVMHQAVRRFGKGGYDRAESDWARSFAHWRTGDDLPPPAPRSAFFGEAGQALARRLCEAPPENCRAG